MEVPPEIRYVDRGGSALAYQVFGEGPRNHVLAVEIGTHLGLIWTDPGYAGLLTRAAQRVRLAMFERHGTGLSDPLPKVRPIEDEAGDLIAVMDACGMRRAVVTAVLTRAPGVLLAATRHPERIAGLVLTVPLVQGWRSAPPEEIEGWTADGVAAFDARFEQAMTQYGTGATLGLYAPGLVSPRNSRVWGLLERSSASPAVLRAQLDAAAQTDVRELLPMVQAPTVIVRTEDFPIPREVFERVAESIPGARLVDAPAGRPDMSFDEFWQPMMEAALLLGGSVDEPPAAWRRLATVLFTDIADSTRRASELGDDRWRGLLDRHDALAQQVIEGAGGTVVKQLGDGTLSTFAGPAQAIHAARRLVAAARELDLDLRAGIHTGECEVRGGDVAGLAVHIGARVGALARPGEVLVSRTVHDLVVGSGIVFASRGEHALKGVPGEWELFAVGEGRSTVELADEARPMRASDRVVLAGARRAPALMRRINAALQRRPRGAGSS